MPTYFVFCTVILAVTDDAKSPADVTATWTEKQQHGGGFLDSPDVNVECEPESGQYMLTLGKPIMMFRVNLINYLVKLHLKCINEYCIRILEILCILKCVVMIDMKTKHILFW